MGKIGFLHTSPVHVPTFNSLFQERNENLALFHQVDEGLLAYAMKHGNDQSVHEKVKTYLYDLADSGSTEIVCTCSTLGAVAGKIKIDGNMGVAMKLQSLFA